MLPVRRRLRLALAGFVGTLVPAGQTIAGTLTPPTTATYRATFHIACRRSGGDDD